MWSSLLALVLLVIPAFAQAIPFNEPLPLLSGGWEHRFLLIADQGGFVFEQTLSGDPDGTFSQINYLNGDCNTVCNSLQIATHEPK